MAGAHVHDYSKRKHPEFVAIDIGAECGALVLETDSEMHGIEVEISPADADSERSHKQILERRAGERAAFTAVFDGLREGSYTLWVEGRERARGVEICGGEVTLLDWRSAR
jgi:hypothetical protein